MPSEAQKSLNDLPQGKLHQERQLHVDTVVNSLRRRQMADAGNVMHE